MIARSFLGEAALPHYTAVAGLVADALGVPRPRVIQTDLDDLDLVVGDTAPTLAFLCGLPFVRLRDRGAAVDCVAAPVPVADDAAAVYFTDLVTRAGDGRPLEVLRLGYNNDASLSGWVLPRTAMRAGGIDPDRLDWRATGSHLRSLRRIVAGDLDAAPVDSTVLDLVRQADAGVAALTVRARYGPMPAPPIVAWGTGGVAFAAAVRRVVTTLQTTGPGRRALALGRVARFETVTPASYAPVRVADRLHGSPSSR